MPLDNSKERERDRFYPFKKRATPVPNSHFVLDKSMFNNPDDFFKAVICDAWNKRNTKKKTFWTNFIKQIISLALFLK